MSTSTPATPLSSAASNYSGDPLNTDAVGLASLFAQGAITAAEHTERVLDRARERDPQVGAFASLVENLSRSQAERADANRDKADAYQDNEDSASLAGVPFPIKDLTDVEGLPFEAGSLALRGNVSARTDGVAQRLLEAHTVPIGKTTTSEFGMSVFSESASGAPARTPWDTSRTAGGSSGGTGAAVASGIVPIAHGNDAGGSVRVPAACNGIAGMVAGRGLISWGPHGLDGIGLARHGVLARTIADVATGLDLLTHKQQGDHFPRPRPAQPLAGAARSGARDITAGHAETLRIGVIVDPMVAHTDLHPEALTAVDRAIAVLTSVGHRVTPVKAPMTPEDWQTFMPVWAVGAASIPLPWGPAGTPEAVAGEEAAGVGALTRWLRGIGAEVSGLEYSSAQLRIQELTRRMADEWRELDLILTPLASGPPVRAHDIPADPADDFAFQSRFTPFTSVWNMNGYAAMSVPLHRATVDGTELPFGVHLAGARPWQEATILRVAAQLEAADPWPHPFVESGPRGTAQ